MKSMRMVMVLALALAACSSDSGGETADAATNPLQITKVVWTHKTPCTAGTADQVTVTTTVTGATGTPTISVSASSCSSATGSPATITCPEAGNYQGMVTVTDSGHTATKSFTIGICVNGMTP